MILKCLKI